MTDLLIDVLTIISSMIVTIFFHELGHTLAGSLLGWRFYYMSFGPVKVLYSPVSGLRIRGVWVPAKWGGAAAVMPKGPDKVMKNEVALVILSGPLMSILMGVFFAFTPLPEYWSWLSLCMGLITIFPFRGGNVYSDGGKMKQIFAGDESCEIELAIFRIGACVLADGDFTNVSVKDLKCLTSSKDLRDQYKGWYYMTLYYNCNGNSRDQKLAYQCLGEIGTELPVSLAKKLRAS